MMIWNPLLKDLEARLLALNIVLVKKNLNDLEKQAKTVKVSIASHPCSISIVNMFSLYTM